MKHDWNYARPNTLELLVLEPFRKCRNCEAEQQLDDGDGTWMRVGRRRWYPLVGRCKP